MGFLLSLLLIFLIFGLILRSLPYLLSWWMNHRVNRHQPAYREREKKEGVVYISKSEPSHSEKVIEKNVGEYVDYEPVKDKD